MASSNRHWPSLFKSKPACSSSPHQWQHDHHPTNHSSLLSSSSHCHKTNSYASAAFTGSEERTPEPKPRWNPKPEQIRILEGIFNSGMVNPPRDEIRRIRSQLQAYGQVGDANVFYWFQNRKSRSKHKQRHLKPPPPPPNPAAAAPCSSSPTSSSDVSPSSGSNKRRMILLPPASAAPFELAEAQAVFRAPPPPPPDELGFEFLAAIPPIGGSNEEAEIWGDIIAHEIGISNSISLGSINMNEVAPPPLIVLPASVNAMLSTVDHTPSPVNEIQQVSRSTVFINDVAYEVMAGPLNIREAFGGSAVLLHSSGQPVLTDEWGLTLLPLQHGASYYLVH